MPASGPSRQDQFATRALTLFVRIGPERREVSVSRFPFTIGRHEQNDLVVAHPLISRQHAKLELEGDNIILSDLASRNGTFIGEERITRTALKEGDIVSLGSASSNISFALHSGMASTATRDFLRSMVVQTPVSDGLQELECIRKFLEAARRLNSSNVLQDVLVTLIEAALRLTGAERGYVFLCDKTDVPRLAAGLDQNGNVLSEDNSISHSSVKGALASRSDFVVSSPKEAGLLDGRQSVMIQRLQTIICIPFGRNGGADGEDRTNARGVLYLDSHGYSRRLSDVDRDLLHSLANTTSVLVENASLVQHEQEARRYQQELAIAATIQHGLMAGPTPAVSYAKIRAQSNPCLQVGGDFYTVHVTEDSVWLGLADVCGKGISAALLASLLQGLVHSHFSLSTPVEKIAEVANKYLCEHNIEARYATLVLARLHPNGRLQFVNCGHIPPLLVSPEGMRNIDEAAHLPVGLFSEIEMRAGEVQLRPNDHFVIVTDGVTEAENCDGQCFELERLRLAILADEPDLLKPIREFCGETPQNDDATILDLCYAPS